MFDLPGFDPWSMTDDELTKKQIEISRRMNWAARYSGSTDMVSQFQSMLSTIDAVRRDRFHRMMFAERQKMFPEIIESDPELAKLHQKKDTVADEEDKLQQRRRASRASHIMSRTASPVNQVQIEPVHKVERTSAPTPPTPKDDSE